jgi:hypothetical protein
MHIELAKTAKAELGTAQPQLVSLSLSFPPIPPFFGYSSCFLNLLNPLTLDFKAKVSGATSDFCTILKEYIVYLSSPQFYRYRIHTIQIHLSRIIITKYLTLSVVDDVKKRAFSDHQPNI